MRKSNTRGFARWRGSFRGAQARHLPNNDNDRERAATYDFIQQSRKQHETFNKALADANGYNAGERKYLTDPPIIYEQPAGTAPTEYKGIGKKRGFWQMFFPGKS